MGYEFSFYKKEDFAEIEELVLASYQWEYPIMGLSRLEFSAGLCPYFTGMEAFSSFLTVRKMRRRKS